MEQRNKTVLNNNFSEEQRKLLQWEKENDFLQNDEFILIFASVPYAIENINEINTNISELKNAMENNILMEIQRYAVFVKSRIGTLTLAQTELPVAEYENYRQTMFKESPEVTEADLIPPTKANKKEMISHHQKIDILQKAEGSLKSLSTLMISIKEKATMLSKEQENTFSGKRFGK